MPYNLRHRVPINYTEVDDEPAETLDVANQNITVQCKSKKRKLSASFNDSRISNLDFKNDSSDYPIKRGRYADLDRSQGSVTTGEINIVTSTPRTTSNVKRAPFVNHDESIDQEQQKGQVANENLGKKYDVPGDGNCLFWSIFFAYLLPIKDDIKEFETRFRKMFPNSNDIEKVRQILCSLNLESLNTINDDKFIREFVQELRKRAYAKVKDRPQEMYGTSRISREKRLEHCKWAEEMQNAQYGTCNVIHRNFWGEDEGLNALAFLLDIRIHEKQSDQKYPSKFNKYRRTGEQILLEVKSGITITLSLENQHYNFYYQDTSSNINLKDSGLGNSINSSVYEDISTTKASSSRKRKHLLDRENIPPKVPKKKVVQKYDEVPVIKYEYSDDLGTILEQEIKNIQRTKLVKKKYQIRLGEELAIIKEFGYSENFLIAANIAKVCQYFKIRYQLVGSANSSLVAKLLDIHTIDPIENELLFEVFLSHNHRPDFDFLIDSSRVHIIKDYLIKHAFPGRAGRAGRMLKKNGKVHPSSIGIKAIDSSLKIVNNEFTDYSESIDKEEFIKFDLLSSEELHKHDQICKQENISLTEININDKNTYQLIACGDVQYLPYVGNISKEKSRKLSPKCFDDLVKLLALIRSGITTDKISVLTGKTKSSLPDPLGVFSSTKGVILFEEQIVLAANKYFAMNMNDAYQFLKNLRNMDSNEKGEYIQEATRVCEKISKDDARKLLNELQKKSRNIFKKSHAIAYASILYKTAYFKTHHDKLFNQIYQGPLKKKKFSNINLGKKIIHKINDTSDIRINCVSLGVIYQLKLIMSILNRLIMYQDDFSLTTEEVGTGKFDDITVRYKNRSKGIYIQAKHIDVEVEYNSINSTQLFPKGRRRKLAGMFSIQKYFNSYVKEIRNKNLLDTEYLIIYTNANFDKNPNNPNNTLKYFFSEHCGIKVDEINIEEDKHKILKDLFYIENATKKHIFYKLSQEKIFKLLKYKKKNKNLLNDFLAKLVFAVNQPNVRELIDSIENDMLKNNKSDYNKFQKNISSWVENKQGYYITKENADNFFEEKNMLQDNSCRELYNKNKWCNSLFFTTRYKFTLCMFLLYRSFIVPPTDKLRAAIKVEIKENSPYGLNDICFYHANETIYIRIKSSIKPLSWNSVACAIIEHLYKLIIKRENSATHFIFYVNLDKEIEEENFRIIDFKDSKYQTLKKYLHVENKIKGSGFYQLSQKSREEIFKKFENDSTESDLDEEFNQQLDKVVLAINQPGGRELNDLIKSKHDTLQKMLLNWLVLPNRKSIISDENWDNFITGKISKATDQTASSFNDRAKNAFAHAIVGQENVRNFRNLVIFLTQQDGNIIFNSLLENKVEYHVSSILTNTKNNVIEVLKETYDTLFRIKIPDGKKTYLAFFTEKNIMPHISSMLNSAGAQAPAAIKDLLQVLSSPIPDGDKTYLAFLTEKNIMPHISSMLSGAGAPAPVALKDLLQVLRSPIPDGDKTHLAFLTEKNIMPCISSMLNGAGARAPAALKDLLQVLRSPIPDGDKTYLAFLTEKNIMPHISSMLNSAGAQAPAALKDLLQVLRSPIPDGDKTYLAFLTEKNIMPHISSMLNGAGAQAPAALKDLLRVLSSPIPNGKKTYLAFFTEKNIMPRISSMLSGARTQAPAALKDLCDTLFQPLADRGGREIVDKEGKKATVAKHLEENIEQLFKTISSNGVKYKDVSNTLKMIHDHLFKFNPNRKEWEKIDDLKTLYADLGNIFENHKKRIKIINDIKCIFNDNKDIGGVICQKANGMDLKSVEYNIQLMVKTGLKIDSILDTVSINKVLCHNNQYLSILLVNETSSNHAVVLLKRNNTISIIDPLSAKSEFSSSLEEIRKDLMTLGAKSVNIIYSDLQQDNYAICADISLILIKNIANKLLDIRSDKDIVKIIENIKAEMYNTLPDLGQKIVSLVSEEKLQDTCGYVPKYYNHENNMMTSLPGKRRARDV